MSDRFQTNSNFRWSSRGQTATIGVVLLLGMVAVSAIGIFLVAGHTVAVIEQDAETERIENSFVELSHSMASATSASESRYTTNLAVGDSGALVKSDTGTIRIQGGDVDRKISIGEIEYRGDDGTRIAYQAGGVWRETGNQTHMLSAPPLEYDHASETLWFPVVEIQGDGELRSGDVSITHTETDPLREASRVENDSVTVTVTSEYYRGWQHYFEEVAGDASVRHVDPENQTVVARLGYLEVDEAFESGVTYSDEIEDQHDNLGEGVEHGYLPPLDKVIDEMFADADNGSMEVDKHLGTVDDTHYLENGTYTADEIDEGHLDFNLTDGNATLLVDGDIIADNRTITVSDYDENHTLKIYATGDYNARNGGDLCVDPCEENTSGQIIQLYGTSEMHVDFGPGGNSRYEGLLYAPSEREDWEERNSCDKQVCMHSNPDFYGALVASSVKAHAAAIEFEYDESIGEEEFELYPDEYTLPPRITYLNVAEYKVEVRNR